MSPGKIAIPELTKVLNSSINASDHCIVTVQQWPKRLPKKQSS
jgi:hypothetical protein